MPSLATLQVCGGERTVSATEGECRGRDTGLRAADDPALEPPCRSGRSDLAGPSDREAECRVR
jgi:hypothetical protein